MKLKQRIRANNWIFFLKFAAILDILTANKFVLTIYTDEGMEKERTRFWKKEIIDAAKLNKL